MALASRRRRGWPRSTGKRTTPRSRTQTVTSRRRSTTSSPALCCAKGDRQAGGGIHGGIGRGEPADAEPLPAERSANAGGKPAIPHDGARTAEGNDATQPQRARDILRLRRQRRLCLTHHPPGEWVASSGAREDARRQGGDGRDRVRSGGEPPLRGWRCALAEPRPADPEARALVTEEWTESAGASPPATRGAAEDDRSGARQYQDPGAVTERCMPGGFDVGDHANATRQSTQRAREHTTLARQPHATGSDHECFDATGPAPAPPQVAQESREFGKRRCAACYGGSAPIICHCRDADPGAS